MGFRGSSDDVAEIPPETICVPLMKIVEKKNLPLDGRNAALGFGRLFDNRFFLSDIIHDQLIAAYFMINPNR